MYILTPTSSLRKLGTRLRLWQPWPAETQQTRRCGAAGMLPRGSIYTTILELAPKRPSPLWFWGSNSIIVVYMDPLG